VSLGRKLAGGLKDLKGSSKAQSGGTIEAHEGKCRATAKAREFDKLAVLLDEVEVWTTLPELSAEESGPTIETQARRIENKIGYMVEGFQTIEFDRRESILQMRSAMPHSDGEDREYFELVLTGGWKATLRRYRGSEVDPGRHTVAMSLTMEVLERLVNDLSTILLDREI
jgi:hypothetical protein